jgi:uncharacterized BrkB/YihY/UPF0761 family membrane protein
MENNVENIKKDFFGKKLGKGTGKFFVGLLMLLILIAINLLVIGIAVFEFFETDIDTPVALTVGIVLSLIYAIVVFVIPYLRSMKNTCRWWAWLAIGDAIWWGYLLISGGGF